MTGPLAGVRVLELGGIGPGPFATLQLAGMGADVVRVDRVGDVGGPVPLAAGKRSVAVDLRAPGGAEAALALVERADVLVEGFRPGVAERLGLGPEACHARNPALVYGRMTGWGQHGPWAQSAGHDINYIALTGALHAIGRADGPPVVPLCLVGDLGGGGMYLVAGVLAALHEARATGRGQVVDAAIVDGVAALMGPIYEMAAAGEWVDRRGSNQLDSGRPWYDVYPARDGRYLAVGAIEDRFYARFAELLGLRPEEADRTDPGCWPSLRERIAARFAAHDRAPLGGRLRRHRRLREPGARDGRGAGPPARRRARHAGPGRVRPRAALRRPPAGLAAAGPAGRRAHHAGAGRLGRGRRGRRTSRRRGPRPVDAGRLALGEAHMTETPTCAEVAARLAFSQAVRAGGLVFVSGQPGVDGAGRVVGDVIAQARQAFANLDAVLREAGSDLAHVVRFTTLLRDIADLPAVVEVRRALLRPPYPADTVLQAAALARPEFALEIDAIAVVP